MSVRASRLVAAKLLFARDVERSADAFLNDVSVTVTVAVMIRQRRTWLELAHNFGNVEVSAVVFDTPYEVIDFRFHRSSLAVVVLDSLWWIS